jgi:hypothetical protein
MHILYKHCPTLSRRGLSVAYARVFFFCSSVSQSFFFLAYTSAVTVHATCRSMMKVRANQSLHPALHLGFSLGFRVSGLGFGCGFRSGPSMMKV